MLSYKAYLEERVSDIVFHKTHLGNIKNILKQNKIRLSAAIGTPSEVTQNKGKFYYFSTARSPLSSYVALDPGVGTSYLVLNGKKLNSKFKGGPVDYWGAEFRKIAPTKNEMEDRIFSDKQYIENAIDYINEIHVLVGYTNIQEPSIMGKMRGDEPKEIVYKVEDSELKNLQEVYSLAKKNNILIYVYNDKESFLTRNKNKTINIIELLKNDGSFKIESPKSRTRSRKFDSMQEWKELLSVPTDNIKTYEQLKTKLSDKAIRRLNYGIVWGTSEEIKRVLSSDIHNSKSDESIGKFVDIMKKLKLKNAEDILEYLKNKWKFVKDLK